MSEVLIRGYKAKEQIEEIIEAARYGSNNCMIGEGLEIIELPPHGDLIDRDVILNAEKTKPIAKMMMFGGAYVIDLDIVRDAPVIVPAERREG